jgi:hypothetical protein
MSEEEGKDADEFDRLLPSLIFNNDEIKSGYELSNKIINFGKYCWCESRRTLREQAGKMIRGDLTKRLDGKINEVLHNALIIQLTNRCESLLSLLSEKEEKIIEIEKLIKK